MKKGQVAPALTDTELNRLLKSIGEIVKEAREGNKTLDDLAYEVNVSRSALARLEAGSDVRVSTLLKVIYGLKIKPTELLKDFK